MRRVFVKDIPVKWNMKRLGKIIEKIRGIAVDKLSSASSLKHLRKRSSQNIYLYLHFWQCRKGLSRVFVGWGIETSSSQLSFVRCFHSQQYRKKRSHITPFSDIFFFDFLFTKISSQTGEKWENEKRETKQKLHKLFHRIIIHLRLHNKSLVHY